MKVVALISGGKDSCYNMMQCVADGHEIVALANLKPKVKDELDSYMYQSVGHHAIDLYAEAIDLPLFRQVIDGTPLNQESEYQPTEGDEVEDLYKLLKNIKKKLSLGLKPEQHLGKSLHEIYDHMVKMEEKYGLNVCGEGGEYETFTLDCPLFKKKIVIKETEMILHSDDAFAPVGYLNLKSLSLQDKEMQSMTTQKDLIKNLPIKLPNKQSV
ncbi:diphthine--ammonia ligase-like [Centruroides sculpturatus]|uniref:diphthine--ammonia ligase-like n=1 Tax=Centruroides sculpturatus TaxID=218467 RepID=UPI000C6E43BD|nr:diphthine--ammonia ligase-like [Centruroides sculpturatus]